MDPSVVPVFFDFVCPWSYSARQREKRLARELGVRFAYMPWELEPDAPAQPRPNPHPDVLPKLRAYARDSGVELRPPARTPNTRRALRGVFVAKANGALEDYLDRTFAAYWEEERDLHDEDVLRRVARESGLDEDTFLHDVLDPAWDPYLEAVDALGEAKGVETTVPYLVDGEAFRAKGGPDELRRKLAGLVVTT
jgi:predicted DsbA family dithiol-disulfide isomerase